MLSIANSPMFPSESPEAGTGESCLQDTLLLGQISYATELQCAGIEGSLTGAEWGKRVQHLKSTASPSFFSPNLP